MNNTLKVFRAQNNLTQDQLAQELGVSRQTVVAIENNKYLPSLGLAFEIAKIFDTSIENIFTYKSERQEK